MAGAPVNVSGGNTSGEVLEIRIEGLLHSGDAYGLGPGGRPVHVANAVPGDVVKVRVLAERKHHMEAELLEVVSAGPDRVEASCPVALQCGGCDFQFLSPAAQVREKKKLFLRAFEQNGLSGYLPEVDFEQSDFLHYRNRIRFGVVREGGRPLIGFRRKHSRDLTEIPECPVASPALNRLLAEIRSRHLMDPVPGELVMVAGERGGDDAAAVFEDRKSGPRWIRRPGSPVTFRTASGLEIGISPLAFSQANFALARKMTARVDSFIKDRKVRVVELFAGIGTFTAGLARRTRWVDAVEVDATALAQLKDNLQSLNLGNVKVYPSVVDAGLAGRLQPCDFLVLDPPWEGCEALQTFAEKLVPGRIAYVSCHPATLARDVKPLLTNGTYRILSAGIYDQFPMTAHIESIMLLERI